MSLAQSIYVGFIVFGSIVLTSFTLYGKFGKGAYAKIIRDVQIYTAANLYLKYGRVMHGFMGVSIIMISSYLPLLLGWNVAAVLTLFVSLVQFIRQMYLMAKVSKDRKILKSAQDLSIFA
jgi:hypothetical protein